MMSAIEPRDRLVSLNARIKDKLPAGSYLTTVEGETVLLIELESGKHADWPASYLLVRVRRDLYSLVHVDPVAGRSKVIDSGLTTSTRFERRLVAQAKRMFQS